MILTVEQAREAHPGAVVREGSVICEGSVIGKGRKHVTHNLVIHGLGNTKNLTAYHCDDGLVINIGCMNDYKGYNLEETRKQIAEKYAPDHSYFAALTLVEAWYNEL